MRSPYDRPQPEESRSGGRDLENKIRRRVARVGVIGLEYVGLPLAVEMAKAGFQVTAIDIDMSKAESVNAGKSHLVDVPNRILKPLVKEGRIKATQSFAAVDNLDAVSICVPTSSKSKNPDLSYLIAAVEAVHNHLHPGQLIIIESTIYPNTVGGLILPILEKTGLQLGEEFFLAYSPERVTAGNKAYVDRSIPKVIGGMTHRCTELAALLYQQFVERIVSVDSPEAAEMVKLLENTYRSVNTAMANEMARTCDNLGISMAEVMGTGAETNDQTAFAAIGRVMDALNDRQKSLKGSKILTLGVACKRDSGDMHRSPAIDVLLELRKKGAIIHYSDPYVPTLQIDHCTLQSLEMTPQLLESMDCVLIMTDHSAFNYDMIAAHGFLILDTRNALAEFSGSNVIRF